jgi:hypothetical protein
VQRELCHRRVVPQQRIQHLDWQGGCHCSRWWQAKARRVANSRRKRKGTWCSGTEARSRGRWALSVEVKNSPFLPLGFIDPWEPRSPNRTLCAH